VFANFEELLAHIRTAGIKKTAAIAAAQDKEVLVSAAEARRLGIMDFLLVGEKDKISRLLTDIGENPSDWEMIDEEDETKAAAIVAGVVADGKVDMPIKGILHTSIFLRALLNKEVGLLTPKALLSQATVFEDPEGKKLQLVTDCVINVAPDYGAKLKIVKSAVFLAHKLGIAEPRVAVLAPVETVNSAMQECLDAAALSKACDRGELEGCIVDGPLSLDLAISREAAVTKGVRSAVAGSADILVVPNLAAGNILDKAIRLFGGLQTAGAILGARTPFIATSRSDGAQNRLNTMAVAILQTEQERN
jgi:phosphate butyryltransferase